MMPFAKTAVRCKQGDKCETKENPAFVGKGGGVDPFLFHFGCVVVRAYVCVNISRTTHEAQACRGYLCQRGYSTKVEGRLVQLCIPAALCFPCITTMCTSRPV